MVTPQGSRGLGEHRVGDGHFHIGSAQEALHPCVLQRSLMVKWDKHYTTNPYWGFCLRRKRRKGGKGEVSVFVLSLHAQAIPGFGVTLSVITVFAFTSMTQQFT